MSEIKTEMGDTEKGKSDSPAFRLRPRAEPKSYYTIRLEYSANPAAFTRERPRSSTTKRRSTSTKTSYSKAKRSNAMSGGGARNGAKAAGRHQPAATRYDCSIGLTQTQHNHQQSPQIKPINVVSKEDLERERRHQQLQRDISQSITTDTMISPFMQRLELSELKPLSIYEHNYITLTIETIERIHSDQQPHRNKTPTNSNGNDNTCANDDDNDDGIHEKHIVCRCYGSDDSDIKVYLNVHLFNEYAKESLLRIGKIINIAKFRTGPAMVLPKSETKPGGDSSNEQHRSINFDVIVKYDSILPTSASTETPPPMTSNSKKPLIPFVSITDMIEEPVEPYVDMPPPSPPQSQPTQTPTTTASLVV